MVNILLSRKSKLLEKNTIDVVSKYIKKDDKVVILGFSFFEKMIHNKNEYENYFGKDSKYYDEMNQIMEGLGLQKKNITWLNYYDCNKEECLKKINEANILYIPGGAPDEMMERIYEKGLEEALLTFDGLVIGSSAGAMIQFNYFHISKDRDYDAFNIVDGLGYLDSFGVEVHYKRKKKQKSGMKKASKLFERDIYTLPDEAMIIIDSGKIKLYDGAKIYYKKGRRA